MSLNSSTSSSNARLLLAWFSGTASILLAVGIGLSLLLEPLDGDLTRIGKLPERFYGYHAVQNDVEILPMPSAIAADIIVLGDSFSARNVWQSELSRKAHLNIITYHFSEIGCLDNFVSQALNPAQHTKVRVLIIQSVERYGYDRFINAKTCSQKPISPIKLIEQVAPGTRSKLNIFPIDMRYQLATAKAAWHGVPSTKTTSKVRIAALNSATLFSSKQSQSLLYYGEDIDNVAELSGSRGTQAVADMVAGLKRIEQQATNAGVHMIPVIIPNKLSVYSPWLNEVPSNPELTVHLYAELARAFGPQADLLTHFRALAATQVDTYKPNDTHFSNNGYRALAEVINSALKAAD